MRLSTRCLIVVALLCAAAPSVEQATAQPPNAPAIEQYIKARRAYETEAAAYWQAITDKRRARIAKRRAREAIALDDYVLNQPPVYTGPPRPPGMPDMPHVEPPKVEIPVVADFLRHAYEQYRFVPDRPANELEFKRAYARVAKAAGLTRDQVVGIYAFETGGNGTYDVQAGLTHLRPGSKAISPAIGYNQLLSTNSVGLLAAHGDQFLKILRQRAVTLTGVPRTAMDQKIEAVKRMIAFSRSVPNAWSDHDRLAKTTPGGMGIHAAVLDIDLGPLLQTQKLLNSVVFARTRGVTRPLTAGELEMMNFTGDGNGIDMVMMPQAMRERVPTSNFFQRQGYERNPIARRTGVVAALFADIERRMDKLAQQPGAKELGSVF